MTDTLKEHLRKIGSKGGKLNTSLQASARAENLKKARAKILENKSKLAVDTEHAH